MIHSKPAKGGVPHALALVPREDTTDSVLMRLIEEVHSACPTTQVVIHPPLTGEPSKRAFQVFLDLYERGLLVRTTGDTVALSPPLIIESAQIEQTVEMLRGAIRRAA